MDGTDNGAKGRWSAAAAVATLVLAMAIEMKRAGAQVVILPPPAIPGVVVGPGILPPPAAVVLPAFAPPPPIVAVVLPPPAAVIIPTPTILPPPPTIVTTVVTAPPPPATVIVVGNPRQRAGNPFGRGFCACRVASSTGTCSVLLNACFNDKTPQCGIANGVCTVGCVVRSVPHGDRAFYALIGVECVPCAGLLRRVMWSKT
ncbi:hypothetical protein GOP47_0007793 [Adiantum capillus-veneris]|uniref:Uncharacterized protein n=1 Tax=Adiantum capillus-veneris TaxID=13818 RepID=A0A9D4V1I7_ADICA|nr:hypothetical protein GOP47_0007793 [Adiantum capillus-veneris]